MYSRLRGKRIKYAVLHADGQKAAAGSTTTVLVDSDGMDIAALSPAEEASRLTDDASREVDRILNLSEEDLEQALKEAWDEAAALARRKKGAGTGKTLAQERGPAPVRGSGRVDSGVCQEAILDAPYARGIGAAAVWSHWLGF